MNTAGRIPAPAADVDVAAATPDAAPVPPVPANDDRDPVERRSIWERIPRWISILGFLIVLVAIWQVLVWLEVTSEFVLPPPGEVGNEIVSLLGDLFTGGFVLDNLWITAREVLIGFVLAGIAGIGLGVLVAETSFGRIVALPFLVAANAAPKVAFAPIFVAWLGFGIWSKVVLAAFIAFFPLLIDTAAGLAGVSEEQLKLFRSMRASGAQTFVKLKLPSALPFIFAGLKTASVLVVVGAIVGEFLGGGNGFGQLLRIAGGQLRIDRVFAYVALLSLIGYAFYASVALVERRVVFWRRPEALTGPVAA